VSARLTEVLPSVQLGEVTELHDQAVTEFAQKPSLLGVLKGPTGALFLGALFLLMGGVVSALLIGRSPLTVILFTLLAISGVLVVLRGRIVGRAFVAGQSRSDAAWQRYREGVIQQLVNPVLREVINEKLYHYGSQLTVQKSPGLMTEDPLFWIDTANSDRLLERLNLMPDGGSIGVAGPRGCGKTTFLRALCNTGRFRRSHRAPEAVLVSAPVEFAPRDFLLTLFAQVCRQSLWDAPSRDPRLQPAGSGILLTGRRRSWLTRHWLAVTAWLCCLAGLVAGPIVVYAALPAVQQGTVRDWLRSRIGRLFGTNQHRVFTDTDRVWRFLHSLDLRLAVIGAVLFLAGLIVIIVKFFIYLNSFEPTTTATETQLLARQHLDEIKFQQSYTYGWSGSLTMPMAQVGLNEARSIAEYQQSLPDIIASLRAFLRRIASEQGGFIIAVDELDKIASDAKAAQFLNDLKGIFGVRNCYYLVSVSEEAMSSFELRGFPFRDAFDSAFDEIVLFRPLAYEESEHLLQRRVVGLSAPYLCLCHCLAGGLPRDLVRVARNLVQVARTLVQAGEQSDTGPPQPVEMAKVIPAMVQLDLQGRADATMIAIRKAGGELDIRPLARWIGRITACLEGRRDRDRAGVSASDLHELCRGYPAASYPAEPVPAGTDETPDSAPAVGRLGLGLAGAVYYLATVLELFRADRGEAEFRQLDGSANGTAATRQIDSLVRARQAFAASPAYAWEQISAFRASWGLSVLDSPVP
jgi:hypothetical protein